GLSGNMTPDAALAVLLSGSQFSAVRINLSTYTLRAMAAAQPVRKPAATQVPGAPPSDMRPEVAELMPVQVLGTHIPRLSMLTARPVTLIDRDQIRNSGFQSLFELLRTQPGVSGHHPVGVAFDDGQAVVPGGAAAAASLDALGPRAVLFLVDGRRPASYGLVSAAYGALFDLDSIPINMVERIEIQRGGSSAIYGSDAIAGVVNIVLRKDMVGSEVAVRYGVSSRDDAAMRRLSAATGFDLAHGGHLFLDIDHLRRAPLPGNARAWHSDDQRRWGLSDGRIPLGPYLFGLFPVGAWPECPAPGDGSSGTCMLDRSRAFSLQPKLSSDAIHGRYERLFDNGVTAYAELRGSRNEQEIVSAPFSAAINAG